MSETAVSGREPLALAKTQEIAAMLEAAWQSRAPIEPLSEMEQLHLEDAYGVQHEWTRLRIENGDSVYGRKIGLTSAAIRRQAGVDEPDYGSLWASRYFPAPGSRAEVPFDQFIQARVEGEIAFLIGRTLGSGRITAQEVLAATEALAVSIEIVDSRIKDWRIKIADTVADNASYGGVVHGPWTRTLRYRDLSTLGMVLYRNGIVAETGVGVAALDGPAHAVAWLANKLASFGEALEEGAIVLSGSLGSAIDVERGDLITLKIADENPLSVRFT